MSASLNLQKAPFSSLKGRYAVLASRFGKGMPSDGKVTLVGAGPGDPELITVKGKQALQDADVIVYDRLVSYKLLELVSDETVKINVGKQPGAHRVSQEDIQQVLVGFAQSGNHVVRLKGGDPFVFGRGFEELMACRKQGIRCQVIPGISSAIAGPTAAGIPVTTRGISRSFGVVTAESGKSFDDPDHDWRSLATLDTLVILMGRRTLANSVDALIKAGKPTDTPVTCVERATLASQRVISGTLSTIVSLAERDNLQSPMVMVIGDVAGFANSQHFAPAALQHAGDFMD